MINAQLAYQVNNSFHLKRCASTDQFGSVAFRARWIVPSPTLIGPVGLARGLLNLPSTDSTKELPLPRFLMLSTAAALVGSVLLPFSSPAQAQFGVEIGPRGPRLYEEREPPPRYIERRRRVIEEDYDDCRWIIRRYTNRFGERVERRERVCD